MYQNGECVAIGTKKEICKQRNIKESTFNFFRTTYYKNRNPKNTKRIEVIRIKDDED